MADAILLPFTSRAFYKTVSGNTTELITTLDKMRETTALSNQLLKENHYTYAKDPTVQQLPPAAKTEVPFLNFSSLQNALGRLETATNRLSDSLARSRPTGNRADVVNQALYKAEQQLLSDNGLPRRPWYRHAIYAPGFYTWYGVKTLPGIREAIEQI